MKTVLIDKKLFFLLIIIDLLTTFVSMSGILDQNIYANRQNSISLYEIKGQDIVTLIVGLLLFINLLLIKKNETMMKIIACLGFLAYIIYMYAYVCFGVISNTLFIFDLTILSLSVYCFIFLLNKLYKNSDYLTITPKYPRIQVSVFIVIIVLLVSFMEIKEIIVKTIFNNSFISTKSVFMIQDLCFLFPAMIIAAILNIKKKTFGVLLTGVFLVKTIVLMPAIIISDVLYFLNKSVFIDLSFDIISLVITMTSLVFFIFYQRGIEKV